MCYAFHPVPGGVLCLVYIIPYTGIFVSSVKHYTVLESFCNFCTTFMALPNSSVTYVTTSYRSQGRGYAFHPRTRGSSVTSVQHHALAGGGL